MPFGLRNASQSFQRLMNGIFCYLPLAFAYVDDVLITSRQYDEHLMHIRIILELLAAHDLIIHLEKCKFRHSRICCCLISTAGTAPLLEKVHIIQDFPWPATVQTLMQFLGLVNVYHRFIPGAASLLCPLHCACEQWPPASPVPWDDSTLQAFLAAKHALAKACTLSHPRPNARLARFPALASEQFLNKRQSHLASPGLHE